MRLQITAQEARDVGLAPEMASESQYLQGARSLLNSEPGGDILGAVRSNGDVLRYNTATNEFAAGTSDGVIRTFFALIRLFTAMRPATQLSRFA
jgi:pyocin large subunit-like protein